MTCYPGIFAWRVQGCVPDEIGYAVKEMDTSQSERSYRKNTLTVWKSFSYWRIYVQNKALMLGRVLHMDLCGAEIASKRSSLRKRDLPWVKALVFTSCAPKSLTPAFPLHKTPRRYDYFGGVGEYLALILSYLHQMTNGRAQITCFVLIETRDIRGLKNKTMGWASN